MSEDDLPDKVDDDGDDGVARGLGVVVVGLVI